MPGWIKGTYIYMPGWIKGLIYAWLGKGDLYMSGWIKGTYIYICLAG